MANHDLALMALGYRFRTGLSVNTSCEFAKAYYKSAAAKGKMELYLGPKRIPY